MNLPSTSAAPTKTEVGSYFISNYPPYSQWSADVLPAVKTALESPPQDVPLGLYLHVPFCRKRCKFCYFRVFTDMNSQEVERYVAALAKEIELVSKLPVLGGRPFRFVYFGGGTPSFLSGKQLTSLVDRLRANIRWDQAEEVTFECEPGTLSQPKVALLKDLGITRLSLGVENFSDQVLEENGRAHLSAEIGRAWEWITATNFPNVNIDLIAGMVGETAANWRENVKKAIDFGPDSVTIYQMELPFNTIYSREMLATHGDSPVADWQTKRDWVDYAFDQFIAAGYQVSSAYTVVKDLAKVNFSYRDNLWRGSDLVATGVASFGHVSRIHYQNQPEWAGYLEPLERGELPLGRGYAPTEEQLLIREVILQIKTGRLDANYFRQKFGVDICEKWHDVWKDHRQNGYLNFDASGVTVTRQGLLRIDGLLPPLFEPQYRGVRYT